MHIRDELYALPGPQSLCNLEFTQEDIGATIDELNASSACGPDGVSALLLKKCRNSLKLPLALLWRESLDSGEIRSSLKLGSIVPIHKGGDKCKPVNYRPVALTSHVIKIMEKIIVKKMVGYLNEANLFNPHQHGFRKNRSCLSQLLEHFQLILQEMENDNEVTVIYLDFCKAFDKVDHKIILQKLHALGITGDLLRWIASFLINRKQVVKVDGKISEQALVKSGVPQGSVLGPLIFLTLISDIDRDLEFTRVSSFADDTRIVAPESSNSQRIIHDELTQVYNWAQENNMTFNETKFEYLQYRVLQQLTNDHQYHTEEGKLISKSTEVKDLGVIMDSDATFETHPKYNQNS